MGFLNSAKSTGGAKLEILPEGSFTMDSSGRILTSTLPQNFPAPRMQELGQVMMQIFRSAQERHLPLRELAIQYAGLLLTVREMRGGALVFFSPRKIPRQKPVAVPTADQHAQ
jgi:hypothetical protein